MIPNDPALFRFRGLFGIPVQVHLSTLFLAAILIHYNSTAWDVVAELIAFTLLMLALYLHGLGQAVVARLHRIQVRQVALSAGLSLCDTDAADPGHRMTILAMGPLTNLTFWALASLALPLLRGEALIWTVEVFATLNLCLAILSLVPMRPLPGGALMHLALSRVMPQIAADRIAGAIGLICGAIWLPAMLLGYIFLGLTLLIVPGFSGHWRMLHLRRALGLREG